MELLKEYGSAVSWLPLLAASTEQPVEGEFTLAEYQKSIRRIVKFTGEPVIVQKLASGRTATVEGYVRLDVVYQSDGEELYLQTSKLPFSRQFELSAPCEGQAIVVCRAATAYLNCRAVNERRIDARGALTLSLEVTAAHKQQFLSELSGEGVYEKRAQQSTALVAGSEEKRFALEEELDAGAGGEPRIIRANARAVVEKVENDAGRAVVSGYVVLFAALDGSDAQQYSVSRAAFKLPYTQTLEVIGALEGDIMLADVSVLSCELTAQPQGGLRAAVSCLASVRAVREESVSYTDDAFAADCALELSRVDAMSARTLGMMKIPVSVRFSAERENAGTLIDYYVGPMTLTREGAGDELRGTAALVCVFADAQREPEAQEFPFEFVVSARDYALSELASVDIGCLFENVECVYDGQKLSLKCDGAVSGQYADFFRRSMLSDAAADESSPRKAGRAALSIVYARAGEHVWDIAKALGADPALIGSENSLETDTLESDTALLVPFV